MPVQITVLTPGILIIEQELTTSLDDFPLEFADPTEWKYYEDVIADCPSRENLNYLLMNPRPLRPRKELGVIVASGWNKIPPQFHDNTGVKAQLLLIDERRNEIYAEFVVRLDPKTESEGMSGYKQNDVNVCAQLLEGAHPRLKRNLAAIKKMLRSESPLIRERTATARSINPNNQTKRLHALGANISVHDINADQASNGCSRSYLQRVDLTIVPR